MKCENCNKKTDVLQTFEGKDLCGVCIRTIKASRKPANPVKGDDREYIQK